MPADGTKAAHLEHGNLGMSRLEQLLKGWPAIFGNGTNATSQDVRSAAALGV